MLPRFEQFVKERTYVMNVSTKTIEWYECSFKWLTSETPTDADLKALVVRMREAGLKATGCNAVTGAINSYLHWCSGVTGKCGGGCPSRQLLKGLNAGALVRFQSWPRP